MRLLRSSAVALAVTSIAVGTVAAFPGAALATQANQAWAGTYAGNGYWHYLGNPSGGGNFNGAIRNFYAGRCLDIPGEMWYSGDGPAGAQVQLWGWNGNANQDWQQYDNGDGSWTYYATYVIDPTTFDEQSFCLDSLGGHHYNGSPVEVYPCNGGNPQKWWIGPGGTLESVDSPGFCADATDWGTGDGTRIQLWQCSS